MSTAGDRHAELAAKKRQETLDTLRDAHSILLGTEELAAATSETLAAQGEQLDRIKSHAEDVVDDVNRANWVLRGMSSTWGWVKNSLFSKPPPSIKTSAKESAGKSAKSSTAAAPAPVAAAKAPKPGPGKAPEPAAAARSTSGMQTSQASVADAEIDHTLDSMLALTGNLQRMGAAMGDELDKHNRQLAEIDARVDEGQAGLKKATRTEARIMRG